MRRIWNYIKDYGGIGLGCAIFAVLFVLKVTGVIGWSWWWISAPLWIPIVIDVVLSVVYVAYQVYLTRQANKESEE
jgi:hypothetical protein